jgi:hypothetical protein
VTLFPLSHALLDIHDLETHALFQTDDYDRFLPLRTSTQSRKSVDACPSQINDFGSLRSSGFKSFNSQSLLSPRVLSSEDDDLSTRVPHRSTVVVHFALRASGVSTLSLIFLLEFFHLKTMICRYVSLTDRQLWFTSVFRIQEFQLSVFAFSRSAFTQRR